MNDSGIGQWKTQSESPPYLREMLLSQPNLYSGLSAAALGSVLSIPFGFAAGLIPLVLFAAGEAIAAMFIPNSASFRHQVDLKYRRKRRENTRQHLLQQLTARLDPECSELRVYYRMLSRTQSLRALASNRSSSLSAADVEQLDDACVDYLGLLLAKQLSEERSRDLDPEALELRAEGIRTQIQASKNLADRRTLQKALDDVQTLIARYRRLDQRKTVIDTALLAMPDTLEEIYHNLITNPKSTNAADYLQSAVERLRIEEELDYSVIDEFDSPSPIRQRAAQSTASQVKR